MRLIFLVGLGMVFAIEALKECRRSKKATMDELWVAARICQRHAPVPRVAVVTNPALRNLLASVREKLRNIARQRDADFGLILVKYGLERILFRLSRSAYHDVLVLKGALLF